MLNLIIQQLYRRKWMERNFHYCLCIFFVLERLLNARLDRLVHQNKTRSCSLQLQVPDKAGRRTASSAPCAHVYMLYLCVRGHVYAIFVCQRTCICYIRVSEVWAAPW